jgi:hypothetical protein
MVMVAAVQKKEMETALLQDQSTHGNSKPLKILLNLSF